MKASTTRTLLMICALLVAAVPSTAAGKVKGLKGTSHQNAPAIRARGLKEDKKAKKTKKAKGPQLRSCRSTSKPNEVTFECSSDTKKEKSSDPEAETRGIFLTPEEEIKDKIKYRVRTDKKKGVRVKIEYEKEVETIQTTTETETEFELTFDSVVEYVKSTREQVSGGEELSQAYDWEADEIVQTIPLERWEDIPGIVTATDEVVSYFTATTILPPETGAQQPGTILFNYTISQQDLNDMITANSMKIDVRILDFPWMRDDSYVALLSTVESKKRVELEYSDDATVGSGKTKETEDVIISFDDEMEEMGITAFGAYTWAHEAEVTSDGTTAVTTERQGGRRRLQGDEEPTTEAPPADGPTDAADAPSDELPTEAAADGASEEPAMVEDVSARPPPPPADAPDGPAGPAGPIVTSNTEGTTIQVIATSPADSGDDKKQSIAYSFVGDAAHSATEIFWDPQAGVAYEEPVSAAGSISAAGRVSFVGSLIAALFYLVL